MAVGLAVGASADVSVGDDGFAVDAAVGIAVHSGVDIAMASAIGLHGVTLLATTFRRSPWNVRGCSWNAVNMADAVNMRVECRGGPWTLPRCSPQKDK